MKTEKHSRYNKAKHDRLTTINYKINIIQVEITIVVRLLYRFGLQLYSQLSRNLNIRKHALTMSILGL